MSKLTSLTPIIIDIYITLDKLKSQTDAANSCGGASVTFDNWPTLHQLMRLFTDSITSNEAVPINGTIIDEISVALGRHRVGITLTDGAITVNNSNHRFE